MKLPFSAQLMLGLSALPGLASAQSDCVPSTIQGVAIERSATGQVILRTASGGTVGVTLPVVEMDRFGPGALLRVHQEQGPDCATPKPPKVEVLGGSLQGVVTQITTASDKLIVRVHPPAAALPGQAWRVTGLLQPPSPDAGEVTLVVPDQQRAMLAGASSGDWVELRYACAAPKCGANPLQGATLHELNWPRAGLSRTGAVVTFLISASVLFLAALLMLGKAPWLLVVGQDNRYSTSKFQVLLWFWVVLAAYLSINIARFMRGGLDFVGGIEIPSNLLALSGISVLSFAAAKGITAGKVQTASTSSADPKPSASQAQVGDLVNDDFQRLDLGDFQIVMLTLLAALMYAVSTVSFLGTLELRQSITMRDLDSTLLGLLGLSHVGYLGNKAAGAAGAGLTPEQAASRVKELLASAQKHKLLLDAGAVRLGTFAEAAASNLKKAAKLAGEAGNAQGIPAVLHAAEAVREHAAKASAAELEVTGALKQIEADTAALVGLKQDWGAHSEIGKSVQEAAATAGSLLKEGSEQASKARILAAAAANDAQSSKSQT